MASLQEYPQVMARSKKGINSGQDLRFIVVVKEWSSFEMVNRGKKAFKTKGVRFERNSLSEVKKKRGRILQKRPTE